MSAITKAREFPADPVERAAIRQRYTDRAVAQAREFGRSIRCGYGDCARIHPKLGRIGCRNDGSGCCCECHDDPTNPTPAPTGA